MRGGMYEQGWKTVARNNEREERQAEAKRRDRHAAIQDSKRRV